MNELSFSKDWCWQYQIRLDNFDRDVEESGLSYDYVYNLTVSDFHYKHVTDKNEKKIMKNFIENHEWLGKISQYPTHWFACYHKDILAGVVIMNTPNAFSKLLGEKTKDIERLLSRGACISWSPKNLASSFNMWSVKWMAKNTSYRLFAAYADPSANELGTIYQACGFYYLGQKSGTREMYVNPYNGKLVSDRFFRQKTAYRKFAEELGIEWQKEWMHENGMNWHLIPDDIENMLRAYSKKKMSECKKYQYPPKHKYAYVIGANKKETKSLRKEFESRNKIYDYPVRRGE